MKVKVDPKLLERARKRLDNLVPPITKLDGADIGEGVVKMMKDLIAKGISPIAGVGKFPPYKALRGGASVKSLVEARKYKRAPSGKKGYPYSVMKEHPGKKITPVNLKLTGDFLRALKYKVTQDEKRTVLEIGYLDDETAMEKESGHREGVNKQPKRPTIPQGRENFAEKIQLYILREFKTRIRNRLKR